MSRPLRIKYPNAWYHILNRGRRKEPIFIDKKDYYRFIDLLKDTSDLWNLRIAAYCLMPNHVHLVMVPSSEDGLRATLGEAHRHYTLHINFRQGWRGHLWQERFHSFLMDEDYLLATVRYVESNPVAAGLCRHPGEWPWSSARAHLEGTDDILVIVKPMLDRVPDWEAYLSSNTRSDRAESIRRHNRTGRPLGSIEFVKILEKQTGKILTPKRPGPKPTSTN